MSSRSKPKEFNVDRARFDAIIAAYGAEPRRWPAEERAAAEAFYAGTRIDLGEAAALDRALDRAQETLDVSLLSARILKQRRALRGEPAPAARWALAACALIGIAAGYSMGATASAVEPAQILGAAITAPFEAAEDFGG
jgi:hypothetical protein